MQSPVMEEKMQQHNCQPFQVSWPTAISTTYSWPTAISTTYRQTVTHLLVLLVRISSSNQLEIHCYCHLLPTAWAASCHLRALQAPVLLLLSLVQHQSHPVLLLLLLVQMPQKQKPPWAVGKSLHVCFAC
jgi:hypothetical protein